MNLQAATLSTASTANSINRQYKPDGKAPINKQNEGLGIGKPKGKNGNNSSFSVKSPDEFMESIREQIQKIKENDKYDDETKKSKIEELEKILKQLEEAKKAQEAQALKAEAEKNQKKPEKEGYQRSSSDGDLLEVSSKAIIESEASLKNLKSAQSQRVQLEGEKNVLNAQIKTDRGRGVDTTRKEGQLAKLNEGIEKTMGNLASEANKATKATKASVSTPSEQPVSSAQPKEQEETTPEQENTNNAAAKTDLL